jgi:hypothetical protein
VQGAPRPLLLAALRWRRLSPLLSLYPLLLLLLLLLVL